MLFLPPVARSSFGSAELELPYGHKNSFMMLGSLGNHDCTSARYMAAYFKLAPQAHATQFKEVLAADTERILLLKDLHKVIFGSYASVAEISELIRVLSDSATSWRSVSEEGYEAVESPGEKEFRLKSGLLWEWQAIRSMVSTSVLSHSQNVMSDVAGASEVQVAVLAAKQFEAATKNADDDASFQQQVWSKKDTPQIKTIRSNLRDVPKYCLIVQ